MGSPRGTMIWVLSVFVASGFAQEGRPSIELVRADSLISRVVGSEEIEELWGDVEIIQGEALIHCQRARWLRKAEELRLSDQVMIFDGERSLLADRVHYWGKRRFERAIGHVMLIDGDNLLICNALDYFQEAKRAEAYGDVLLKNFLEKAVLKCDTLVYRRDDAYVLATGNPCIVRTDSMTGDTLAIKGEIIEAWEADRRAVVTDSVVIKKGQLTATCSLAEYRSGNSELILTEYPSITFENQHMKGDIIELNLEELKFQGGVLKGNPEIVTRDSALENTLLGKTMQILAKDDTIHALIVEGQATSTYYLEDESGDPPGLNTVTGDVITVHFSDNKVDRVTVDSKPGQCNGIYEPKTEKTKKNVEGKERAQ